MKSILALSLITGLTFSILPATAQIGDLPPIADGDGSPVAMVPLDSPEAMPLGGGPGGKSPMNFSNDQLEKIYKLKNNLLDELGPKMTELKKEQRHLKDLLTQESLDRKAIQSAQDKINTIKADISNQSLAFKMDFNETLTAEQRQNIRYKRMKPGHQRGKRHHQGQGQMRRGFNGSQNVVGQREGGHQRPQADNNLTAISESL